MEQLSLVLWRERELLDTLVYRLETEQLMLPGGRACRLARAADEVEAVLGTLRETEILRAMVADEAAAERGLASNPSLRALADAADEPWRSILHEHREAFEAAMREVTSLAEANRELLTDGYRTACETLLALGVGSDRAVPGDEPPARRLHPLDGGRPAT